MPEMPGIAETNWLAVFQHVGDDQDLRVAGQLELTQHVDLQRPETAAEADLLVGRDALVAKHDHVMIQVSAMNALEIIVGKRLAQVKTGYFSA
jgi:hypothetical protein